MINVLNGGTVKLPEPLVNVLDPPTTAEIVPLTVFVAVFPAASVTMTL
jgi:hypothetical protein